MSEQACPKCYDHRCPPPSRSLPTTRLACCSKTSVTARSSTWTHGPSPGTTPPAPSWAPPRSTCRWCCMTTSRGAATKNATSWPATCEVVCGGCPRRHWRQPASQGAWAAAHTDIAGSRHAVCTVGWPAAAVGCTPHGRSILCHFSGEQQAGGPGPGSLGPGHDALLICY